MKYTLAFVLLMISLTQSTTYACTCVGTLSVKQAFKKSKKVFVGTVIDRKVVSIDTIYDGVVFYQAVFTFQIAEVFKGRKRDSTFVLQTGLGGGDCGFEFQVGEKYFVYAYKSRRHFPNRDKVPAFYKTDICTRTTADFEGETSRVRS